MCPWWEVATVDSRLHVAWHQFSIGTWVHTPSAVTPQCLRWSRGITVHAMDKRVSPRIVAQAIIFLSGEINTDFLLKNIIRSEYIEKISVWVYKDYCCICIRYHSLLWLEDYQLYIPWHYTVERKFSHIIFSCILFIIKTSVSQRSCWKQIQFLYNFYVLFGSHWK